MIYIAYIYIIYRLINLEIRLVVSNVKREVERAKNKDMELIDTIYYV